MNACVWDGVGAVGTGKATRTWTVAQTSIVWFALLGLLCLATGVAHAQPVTWNQQVVSSPTARYGSAMAYDSTRGETVLFGGITDPSGNLPTFSGETWAWNGAAWNRRQVSGPSPRAFHAMAYDSDRGVTVLFGGYTSFSPFPYVNGETWEWDGTAWTQQMVSNGPSPRYIHAMVYDANRHVTVLFGGNTASGPGGGSELNGETWEWNGDSWTQRCTDFGPSPRSGHSMTFDSARRVTVLFGGQVGSSFQSNNDTWEWNGIVWNHRQVEGPSPRYSFAMAYDTARSVSVLFGGGDVASTSETWEWNGLTWTQQMVAGPSPRFTHAMTYDIGRGKTVLFGGNTAPNVPNGETWELCGLTITTHPSPQTACGGGAAVFAVAASGSVALSYQWRKNCVPLIDQPSHIFGATSSVLSLMNVTIADDGIYDCVVTNACGSFTSRSAALRVAPADFNRDGVVNSQDLFDFLAAFFTGC